jgi:hypothetical protein
MGMILLIRKNSGLENTLKMLKKRTVWNLIMMNIKWYIFRKSRMRKSVQIREVIWEIDQLKGVLSNTKYRREMNMLWGE